MDRPMKHFILTPGVLLLFITSVFEMTGQNTLYVKEKAGTQTGFILTAIRKLNFSGDTIKITTTGGANQNYRLSDIRFLSFKNYFTSIANPGANQIIVLKLYPNPVSNKLQIEYTGEQTAGLMLEILDLQGRVLKRNSFQCRKASIDVPNIKAGMYLCRLRINSEAVVAKFIKY